MAKFFAGSEIVEIGVQIEKNGRDFYAALVKGAGSEEAKKVFQYLAGEEEKHIAVFQGMLEKVEKYEPPEAYPGEYFAYMNALASEYVFTQKDKGAELAKSVGGEAEALARGIDFEKDSILFYEGMKTVVPEYDRHIVGELIEQEKEHLRKLVDLKQKI